MGKVGYFNFVKCLDHIDRLSKVKLRYFTVSKFGMSSLFKYTGEYWLWRRANVFSLILTRRWED